MLSIIVTFYEQPAMLAEQARIWRTYKADPEIIVVDDGSAVPAAAQPRSSGYRVTRDIPWHQDGARNLGAHVATGDWLLFLDIDHAISAEELSKLLGMLPKMGANRAFRPERRLVDEAYPLKRAANIWLIRRADFWRIGGYDERLCGHYGTDMEFRPRLRQTLREADLPITLDVYRRANIPDAATAGLDRSVVPPPKLTGPPKVLGFEWERSW
jgi:predicted glycosyltransferase involved in capsule biosynthesis